MTSLRKPVPRESGLFPPDRLTLKSVRKFEEGRPSSFIRGDRIAQEVGESALTARVPAKAIESRAPQVP